MVQKIERQLLSSMVKLITNWLPKWPGTMVFDSFILLRHKVWLKSGRQGWHQHLGCLQYARLFDCLLPSLNNAHNIVIQSRGLVPQLAYEFEWASLHNPIAWHYETTVNLDLSRFANHEAVLIPFKWSWIFHDTIVYMCQSVYLMVFLIVADHWKN